MIAAIYVLLAVLVGWLGRHKQVGFVGFLVLSLVFTPVVTLLVLMMSHDRRSRTVA